MSPLQLKIIPITKKQFGILNKKWHSRLPVCNNLFSGKCYGAEYKNLLWAVAWWSKPIAGNRLKNGNYILELRRMAIHESAPKNTASRFLSIMIKIIKKEMPNIYKLISYQDTSVHFGTIYKASGWNVSKTDCGSLIPWTEKNKRFNKKKSFSCREGDQIPVSIQKIRWEKQIRKEPKEANGNGHNNKKNKNHKRNIGRITGSGKRPQ